MLKAYWSQKFARADKRLSNITGSRLCHPPTAEYVQNWANLLQETLFWTKSLFIQPCMFSKGCFSDHRILMQARRPLKELYFYFNFFSDTHRLWNFTTRKDNFSLQNIFHSSLHNIFCTVYKFISLSSRSISRSNSFNYCKAVKFMQIWINTFKWILIKKNQISIFCFLHGKLLLFLLASIWKKN